MHTVRRKELEKRECRISFDVSEEASEELGGLETLFRVVAPVAVSIRGLTVEQKSREKKTGSLIPYDDFAAGGGRVH